MTFINNLYYQFLEKFSIENKSILVLNFSENLIEYLNENNIKYDYEQNFTKKYDIIINESETNENIDFISDSLKDTGLYITLISDRTKSIITKNFHIFTEIQVYKFKANTLYKYLNPELRLIYLKLQAHFNIDILNIIFTRLISETDKYFVIYIKK